MQWSMADDPVDPGPLPPQRRGLIGGAVSRIAPAVMSRIDMDAILEQLDMNAIVEQLDVNAIAARLDMDAVIDGLDVNAIADRLDLDALMARMDMGQLTANVTQDVATSGVDLVRRQLVRSDATVDGLADRLLRREPGERPVSPSMLEEDAPVTPVSADPGTLHRRDVSGHYAGPVTRFGAMVGDLFAGLTLFGLFGAVSLYFFGVPGGVEVADASGGWLSRVLAASWMLLWFWVPVALFGRTPVMGLLGIAVVRRDGGVVNGRRALLRTLVMPISVAILLLGLIGIVVGRERRTLHDVVAGTAVVYDWGPRQAEQPVSIREQLTARVGRRRANDSSI